MKSLLVILAGGQATRMKIYNSYIAKCILPVGNTTLLRRQLHQAEQAGIDKIIVSTNKIFYDQIRISITDLRKVRVVLNPLHKDGSMAALWNIIKHHRKGYKILMSFGDIFFIENPFFSIKNISNTKGIYLSVSKAFNKIELSRGGIVFAKSRIASGIVEKPIEDNLQGFRWNGIAAMDYDDWSEIEKFLILHHNFAEEDFFEDLRKNFMIKVVSTKDFLNVNNSSYLFVASLYQSAETTKDPELKIYILKLANLLRTKMLNNKFVLSD